MLTAPVGWVHPSLEPVASAFEEVLADRPGFGASLCVYVDGEPFVDLWGGGYRPDSLQVVFSSTKGAMAICAAMLVQRGLLDVDAPVASIWPEFAQMDKGHIPVRWILGHRAGLPTPDGRWSVQELYRTPAVVAALEKQEPFWEPGSAHGYHALTIGTLMGEILRRVDGRSLGAFFAEEIAGPLDLEFWIGLPPAQEHRVLPIRTDVNSLSAVPSTEALAVLADPGSIPSRVLANGLINLPEYCNTPAFHAAEAPAASGITDARSLARMYAACLGQVEGVRLLEERVVADFAAVQSDGMDLVSLEHTRYGSGFMLPLPRLPMTGPSAFGHDGAGGSLAFADRELGVGFAFLTDRFPSKGGADPAAQHLAALVAQCLRSHT